jgi:hypothetical protein
VAVPVLVAEEEEATIEVVSAVASVEEAETEAASVVEAAEVASVEEEAVVVLVTIRQELPTKETLLPSKERARDYDETLPSLINLYNIYFCL